MNDDKQRRRIAESVADSMAPSPAEVDPDAIDDDDIAPEDDDGGMFIRAFHLASEEAQKDGNDDDVITVSFGDDGEITVAVDHK